MWTLTLKNADEKSVLVKPVSGNSTAASATPPGCTKFIARGLEAKRLVAASPVSIA